MPRVLLAPLALLAALAFAAPAAAETQELTYRVGPIDVGPYQVRQNGVTVGIPKPEVDGYITKMETEVVDADGTPVPISRLMLHHIVFTSLGASIGSKQDQTCDEIINLDSVTKIPALAERFYAAGEERAKLALPAGYGYHVGGGDTWAVTWMLMNHRAVLDQAYIQYKVTYETAELTPVKPVWLDVRNCRTDPVYDVPGGGKPGSLDKQTVQWTPKESGRIVAGGGHVHGGGLALNINQPDCGDRQLVTSTPTWGAPSHPFYNVKPVLHEPGPVHMTGFTTPTGFPIEAGKPVTLTSVYDAERPHTRVMGIMQIYVAPPAPVALPACAALPTDIAIDGGPGGRTGNSPKVTVPLTGLDSKGRARTIKAPPGRLHRTSKRSAVVRMQYQSFSKRNLSVPAGAKVNWRFLDADLHDVTVASGPRGFSSPHYGPGSRFSQKLTVPGTYRLFCSLHPVAMTERIVVRR